MAWVCDRLVVIDYLEQCVLVLNWVFSIAYDFWALIGPALPLLVDNIYILCLALWTFAVETTGQVDQQLFPCCNISSSCNLGWNKKILILFRILSSNNTASWTTFWTVFSKNWNLILLSTGTQGYHREDITNKFWTIESQLVQTLEALPLLGTGSYSLEVEACELPPKSQQAHSHKTLEGAKQIHSSKGMSSGGHGLPQLSSTVFSHTFLEWKTMDAQQFCHTARTKLTVPWSLREPFISGGSCLSFFMADIHLLEIHTGLCYTKTVLPVPFPPESLSSRGKVSWRTLSPPWSQGISVRWDRLCLPCFLGFPEVPGSGCMWNRFLHTKGYQENISFQFVWVSERQMSHVSTVPSLVFISCSRYFSF